MPHSTRAFSKQEEVRLGESLGEHNVENTNPSISQQNQSMGELELVLRQVDSAGAQLNSDSVPDLRDVVCKRLLSKEGAVSGEKAGRCWRSLQTKPRTSEDFPRKARDAG